MQPSLEVPNPEPGDAPEVVAALEAGARSWSQGDADEALRQVARAAEAAGDLGDDRRALGLARSVAELRERLRGDAEHPTNGAAPASIPPPPPSVKPPPLPSTPAKARSIPPPPPSARATSTAPPAAASVAPRVAPPPAASVAPKAASPSPATGAPKAASVAPKAAPAPAASVAPKAAAERSPPPSSETPFDAAGVRVSVKSSVRDPHLLIVRVLRQGQKAPPGTREAVLTMPDGAGAAVAEP